MTLGIGMAAVGAGYTIVLAGENSSSIVDFGVPRSSNALDGLELLRSKQHRFYPLPPLKQAVLPTAFAGARDQDLPFWRSSATRWASARVQKWYTTLEGHYSRRMGAPARGPQRGSPALAVALLAAPLASLQPPHQPRSRLPASLWALGGAPLVA